MKAQEVRIDYKELRKIKPEAARSTFRWSVRRYFSADLEAFPLETVSAIARASRLG